MLTPTQNGPRYLADSAGERLTDHQNLTESDGSPSSIVHGFIHNWELTARRFLSAFRCDTFEGHRLGVDMHLCADDFPRPELWECGEALALCGLCGIQTPSLDLIRAYAEDSGTMLFSGNPADLNWLETLEISAARCAAYAADLRGFSRRATLARVLYRAALSEIEGDIQAIEQPIITSTIRRRSRRAG